jgi:hypothetical protein
MRLAALEELRAQRSIDRCLFQVLRSRCAAVTSVSASNHRLKQLITALVVIETSSTVGSAIPVAGAAIRVSGKAAAEALRATANLVARFQDFQLATQNAAAATLLWRCGIPLKGLAPIAIERRQTPQSSIAKAPAPLTWKQGQPETELNVKSWSLSHESFGSCLPESPTQKISSELNGEKYLVVFQHEPEPLEATTTAPARGRSGSKPFSFSL